MATLSAQIPATPVLQAGPADGMTVSAPIFWKEAMKVPFVAAQMPQDAADMDLCVEITGPARCSDLDNRDMAGCSLALVDCDTTMDHTKDSSAADDNESDVLDDESNDKDTDVESDDGFEDDDHEDMFPGSEPASVSATATGAAEDYGRTPTAAANMHVARADATDIPASIQNALISDKNAPRSLAKEFSGNKTPEWYKHLPKDQRQFFLTERTPKPTARPKPTSTHPDDVVVTHWCPEKQHSPEQLRDQYIMDARVARLSSKIAHKHSKLASSQGCKTLSSIAVNESVAAARKLVAARQNMKALNKKYGKHYKTKGAASATLPKSSALLVISFTIAVGTLGVAAYL